MTLGQFLLVVIAGLLAAIATLIGWLGKNFQGQIHDSNSVISAIQQQSAVDRSFSAVMMERLTNHIESQDRFDRPPPGWPPAHP